MKPIDPILEEKLLKRLDKLNRKIAWVGDKELRQRLDYHVVEMYKLITNFDADTQEKLEIPSPPPEPKKPDLQYSDENYTAPIPSKNILGVEK